MNFSNEGLITFGALVGSKDVILKILGPSAEYLGLELRTWTEKRANNLKRIFEKTEKRINQDQTSDFSTPVSPQLLKSVLDFGSFIEDELIQDYISGLIFSSRKGLENDNRPAVLALLIQNMSVYEIRLHYLIYSLLRDLYLGFSENIGFREIRSEMQTFISSEIINDNIINSNQENEILSGILESSLYGLHRHNLIEPDFALGRAEHLAKTCKSIEPNNSGIVIQPSILGIELYLWISGLSSKTHSQLFLSKDENIPLLTAIHMNRAHYYRYPG